RSMGRRWWSSMVPGCSSACSAACRCTFSGASSGPSVYQTNSVMVPGVSPRRGIDLRSNAIPASRSAEPAWRESDSRRLRQVSHEPPVDDPEDEEDDHRDGKEPGRGHRIVEKGVVVALEQFTRLVHQITLVVDHRQG